MDIFKNLFSNKSKKQSQLSVEEAHRLWAKAQARYILINNINFFSNLVHDQDFKKMLDKVLKIHSKQIKILEQQLNKYAIKSPEPSKVDTDAIVNTQIIDDQDIARTIYSLLQLAIGYCLKTIKNTTFNDNVRGLLTKMTKEEVNILFDFINYMDSKGWLEHPPLYPNTKGNKIIGANEVWELWQHLYNRYLSLQQTKIFSNYTSDADLQALFILGNKILTEQTNKIEQILLNFGVSLPRRHPKNIPAPESKEIFDDQYMFQLILNGLKNATTLYGFAIQELVINQELQELFKELIFDEIGYIDKLIRYGKVKGWVPQVPIFRP